MIVKAKTKKTETHTEQGYIIGYFLPHTAMTGENFNGFIETYGAEVGAIVVDENGVAWEVEEDSVVQSVDVNDVNGDPMFVGDAISLDPQHPALIVARSNYVAYRDGGKTKLMPSLVISNMVGESIVELVQRSDGSWLKMNSVGSFNLELIKDVVEIPE